LSNPKFAAWIKAGRPRTLPLSVSGILTGGALTWGSIPFEWLSFGLCVLITLLFQIVSNLANDLGDGLRGTDNEHRLGPARTFQSGLLGRKDLLAAIRFLSLMSLMAAGLLLFHAFGLSRWPWIVLFTLLAIGSIWAARRYTMGSRPYGYRGLGDLSVFFFFGLLAVLGTEFVLSFELGQHSILPASAIGLLSTAVLNLNNMRDADNDAKQGKITLAVRLGERNARYYHVFLIGSSLICWLLYLSLAHEPSWLYATLWPFSVLAIHVRRVFTLKEKRELDPELKKVAISTFLISLTFITLKGAFS